MAIGDGQTVRDDSRQHEASVILPTSVSVMATSSASLAICSVCEKSMLKQKQPRLPQKRPPSAPPRQNVIDLMDALRKSLTGEGVRQDAKTEKKPPAASTRRRAAGGRRAPKKSSRRQAQQHRSCITNRYQTSRHLMTN